MVLQDSGEEESVLQKKLYLVPETVKDELVRMIVGSDVFVWSVNDLCWAYVPFEHSFDLNSTRPIYHMSLLLLPVHNEVVESDLGKMLDAGNITPFLSVLYFPSVISSKKDGPHDSVRATGRSIEWLGRISSRFLVAKNSSAIFRWTVVYKTGFFYAYWQVRMVEDVKGMTTFLCNFVTYQFEVIPFRLMNEPSTFQSLKNMLFRDVRLSGRT